MIAIDNYLMNEDDELFRGFQGIIFSGRAPDGTAVVFKEVAPDVARREHAVLREVWRINGQPSHVVRLLHTGVHSGRHFLIYERLSRSLADVVKPGQMRAEMIPHLALDVARGTQEVHAAGYQHGDIKPANLILSGSGSRIVQIDFGSAVRIGEAPDTCTEGYAPPEVIAGKTAETTDVYAWARVQEYLITGWCDIGPRSVVTRLLPWIGKRYAGLIQASTHSDPGQRPKPAVLVERLVDAFADCTVCARCGAWVFADAEQPHTCT